MMIRIVVGDIVLVLQLAKIQKKMEDGRWKLEVNLLPTSRFQLPTF